MGCSGHKEKKLPAMTPENTLKILCLGVGGCGKTTFVKQMKIIHGVGWDSVELQNFVKVIRGNYINGMQDALEIGKKLGMSLQGPHSEEAAKQLSSMRARTVDLGTDQIELLKQLWSDPAIQDVIMNHNEMLTVTHFAYFWQHLDRITQPEYAPTDEDILRARMRTAGANSCAVYIDKNYFEFFDVGGQKPERAKWEGVLQEHNFAALIYFVAADEFDVDDEEKDFDRTKMEISRFIFSEIVNSNIVPEDVPVILFLNREDLFEQRMMDPLGYTAFKETFPEYEGPQDKQKGLEYIRNFFLAVVKDRNKPTNPIKCHYTCALDRDSLVMVWRTVREFLLTQALHDIGLV